MDLKTDVYQLKVFLDVYLGELLEKGRKTEPDIFLITEVFSSIVWETFKHALKDHLQ